MPWASGCNNKGTGRTGRGIPGRSALVTPMSELIQRFDAICERIASATAVSGRADDAVRLVAVSKRHGAAKVAELAAYWSQKGTPVFGESYMQEARDKKPEVADLLLRSAPGVCPHWHFIGHIQSKKARDVIGQFDLLHSVDSLKLAQSLQKAWQSRVAAEPVGLEEQAPPPQAVLIQVNIGLEDQKSGVDPRELEELLAAVSSMPELSLQGLMCIPPLVENAEESRPYFIKLRELRDQAVRRLGISLPHLSMGMSDDFEAAVEEGATLVRIGTDIFGPRV